MPVHRALTEPILLGGAPRAVAILNGTLAAALGLGLRLWIAGLAALGDRSRRRRLGGEARSAVRRRRAPASAHPRPSRASEAPHDEPRRISPLDHAARGLPALGGAGRRGRRPQQGRLASSARRGFAGRISIAPCRPNWSASPARLNNALRRLGSGWAVFVEAQRHPASHYPESRFPGRGVGPGRRSSAAPQFEEEGAHFESSYFLTFLYLPPAEDAARAERLLYEGRERTSGVDAREAAARLRRSHRPRARSWSRASCPRSPGSMTARR